MSSFLMISYIQKRWLLSGAEGQTLATPPCPVPAVSHLLWPQTDQHQVESSSSCAFPMIIPTLTSSRNVLVQAHFFYHWLKDFFSFFFRFSPIHWSICTCSRTHKHKGATHTHVHRNVSTQTRLTHAHTHTHTRARARAHTRTHAHTYTHT